ncbi:MAG: hydroxysqualene dehydroxylase HpnE, partial [Pseudomonadota bacterium]
VAGRGAPERAGGHPEAHVVGAGLAGLSSALRLAERGYAVTVHEATDHAGGRCRSFYEPRLEREIDNGNHLVLTGNGSVAAYVATIGAGDRLRAADRAAFPFAEPPSGKRWTVDMNRGPLPWWVAVPNRRIPDTGLGDYLAGARLALAGADATVAEALPGRGPIWTRFWEPMTLAALNTTPERGAARLLWAVMRETFARGERHCRPMFAPEGLGAALVGPALAHLEAIGARIRFKRALAAVERGDGRATALLFSGGERLALGPRDQAVLALPPTRLRAALPEVDAPEDRAAIVNAHFVVPDAAALADAPPILGLIGTKTHWVFTRGDVVSLTISAADRLGLAEADGEALLAELWEETRAGLGLGPMRPLAARLIREKRATFDQSPAGVRRRPQPRTPLRNLTLAGDATDTGLPATIEGAIRSGERAAALVPAAAAAP